MRRCIMCDEPNPMYIPDDVVDDYGTYSCGSCGFEMECARELPAPPVTAIPPLPAEILVLPPHVDEPALEHTPPALLLAGSNYG